MRLSLNKSMRISSSQEIAALINKGRSYLSYPLKIFYIKREEGCEFSRMAVSVPKRSFKRAVDRNLLKRRIRESYRINRVWLDEKGIFYDILIIYIGKELYNYDKIEGAIRSFLAKIG